MVEIKFDANKYKLEAKGHAGSAPKGEDLVCAAVSALLGAMAQTGSDLWEGNSCMKPAKIIIKNGLGKVQLYPKEEYKETVSLMFYPICEGMQLIAEKYPEYATFEWVRND